MAKLLKLTQLNTDGSIMPVSDFFMDLDSGIVQFVKRIEGKLFYRSTKIVVPMKSLPTTPAIVKKAKESANSLLNKKKSIQRVRRLLEEEWDLYYAIREKEQVREGIDESTLGVVRRAGDRIKQFWEGRRPEEITKDTWLDFVDWHEENYQGQTLFNVRKYFRTFCQHLHEKIVNGHPLLPAVPTMKNPYARRERLNRKRKKARVLTKEEIQNILVVCDECEQLVILLMWTMAFRIDSDALSARWDQFRLDDVLPVYVFGEEDNKADLDGKQAIHPEVLRRLKLWRQKIDHSKWVFPQLRDPEKHIVSQMIDFIGMRQKSGVNWKWTPHTFRHTCFTDLADSGYPQHLICKCFRISPKQFMETYTHLSKEGLASMQNAIKVEA